MSHNPLANIASKIDDMAALLPHRPAIFFPHSTDANGKVAYTHYTFAQLKQASDVIGAGLRTVGIARGTRTALMVKPSLEFFALTFAIFRVGAVPVFVDPGIGVRSLKICLGEAQPEAFIGIPPAHVARIVLGWARDTIRTHVTVGRRLFWGGYTLEDLKARGLAAGPFEPEPTRMDDVAAILFTSGSTGVPKGVVYTHGTFVTQTEMIRQAYNIQPGEVDLPTFPLFALFDPALGMTSVIPDMDFTRPAKVNPAKLVAAVEDFGVTNMFGSPALLNTVGRWCEQTQARMPTVRRVISAGAPVAASVIERFLRALPEGALIHTPYGATESLPVASISSATILGETREATDEGRGVCVGRPVEGITARVISITDDPIEVWRDDLEVPPGVVGEITVCGPVVTRSYYRRDESTRLAKIHGPAEGQVWHRMGDLGYFDDEGRLWFCGRKSHRVRLADETLYTIPCEAVFNVHPKVFRTALVGVNVAGRTEPLLCVELESHVRPEEHAAILGELAAIAPRFDHTRRITRFLVHPGFPVDIRHNAKIGREKLAVWAQEKVA